MDIIQLYIDYGVVHQTEGHKHCRPGWVNTPCPWCISEPGHEGLHLGFHLEDEYYVCWRCGWHPILPTLSRLTGLSDSRTREVLKRYGIRLARLTHGVPVARPKVKFELPTGVSEMTGRYRRYLEGRCFDPTLIERIWSVQQTGPMAFLFYNDAGREVKLNYSYRLLIPFSWNGETVSFDSRDVTERAKERYKACPTVMERVPRKEILYCRQDSLLDVGVAVEGPTDVWRFGVKSFAVSGIKYTPRQVRLISEMFRRVPVCFDGGEPQAREQADKLVSELRFRGVDSFRVDIEGDPGDMKQKDADHLMRQLTIKYY